MERLSDADWKYELEQAIYISQEQAGRSWSEAHPLDDGVRFSWRWDYDMDRTHYREKFVCSNCFQAAWLWIPKGQKLPRKVGNPEPCGNCGVKCHLHRSWLR